MRHQIGDYQLLRLLGKGGFGEVYLGQHVHQGTLAAVKVLKVELTNKKELEEFLNEARTFRLRHPHIVALLDFGLDAGHPFLVMEYAPGGTLRQRHPRGTCLPLSTIVSYVTPIAAALQYAHDQRVVHRDVKPENMLIGGQDKILLSDFGIAVVAHSTASLKIEEAIGSVAYMAPEQSRKLPRPASDQYALGVVVYEWITGTLPFTGSTLQIVMQHLSDPVPPLRARIPTTPALVEEVVLKALSKDPQERFARVEDFAQALAQAVQPGSFSVGTTQLPSPEPFNGSPPANYRQTRMQTKYSISRRALLIGLASASTIGLGATIVASMRLPQRQIQQPASTSVASHTLTSTPQPPGAVLYRYRGHQQTYVADVAWSYNSRRIASADATNKTVHVWDALDGGNTYIYRGHRDYLNFVCWSPDGKRIASAGGGYEVHVWDQADGGHPYIYRGHTSDSDTSNGSVTALVWSSDGKYIASSYDATGPGNHGAVHVWSAQSGSLVRMYRGQIDQIQALSWSPDSQYLVSASTDRTIQVWQAVKGNLLYTRSGNAWERALAWSPNGKYIAVSNNDNNTVEIWDANGGTVVNTYRGHRDVIYCLSWSPDSLMLASGSRDQTFQIWTALDSHLVYRLPINPPNLGGPEPIAWSPDGKMIASVSDSLLIEVWVAPTK